MDSNTTSENSASANPGRNAADKSGSFSGNRNNYNKKKKQRHFGPTSNVPSAAGTPAANQPPVSQGNATLRPPKSPNQNQPGGNVQRAVNPQQKASSTAQQQQQPMRMQQPHAAGQPNNPPANRNFNPQQSVQQRQQQPQKPTSPQAAQPVQQQHQQQAPSQPSQATAQIQQQRPNQQSRKWETRAIKIEETFEDIKKDNERIEKEIWLEIAEIHNAKLD
ncbi:MAG: hypothetical protein ACYCYI_08210 [Saccharofermentanales bacterium]